MNSAKNQQIEFDVFPKDSKGNYSYLSGVKTEISSESAAINVVFSHQSIIIVFIGIIMLLVASFTLGVEKGKLVSRNTEHRDKISVSETSPMSAQALIATPAAITVPAAATKNAAPAAAPVVVAASPALTAVETPAAETVPTPAAADKPAAGSYAIQVATVKTQNSAKQLADTLAKKGWKSFVRPSGDFIIILAGNFSKKEDAQKSVKELKKTYTDCFIKKI